MFKISKRFICAVIFISLILTTLPVETRNLFSDNQQDTTIKIPNANPSAIEDPDQSRSGTARGNEAVTFTNVTNDVGLSNVGGNYLSWTDYNNDGYFDLLVNGRRLFANAGPPDYNFTEVTGPANITGGVSNGIWGDYDNDGFLDFFAGAGKNNNDKLWHNNGNGTFENVAVSAGGVTDVDPTTAAGWGDFDKDGDLDLYVANGEDWSGPNPVHFADKFYRNNGNGTFTDITVAAGIDDYTDPYYGRSVAWADYNNDGWLDIHVGNYRLHPNYLWRNNHDGTFTDVAGDLDVKGVYDDDRYYDAQAETTYGDGTWGPTYGHTIGSAWGDLDNDGFLDLWDSNLVHKYVGPSSIPNMPYDIRGYVCDDSKIYRNNGAPNFNFTDARSSSGISFRPIGGSGTYTGDELWSGVAIGDYDNDGDLDVYIPQIYDLNYAYSLLYRNNNDGTFTDVAQSLGLRVYNTYGGTWCDYNNDGFLDLATMGKAPFGAVGSGTYEVRLFENGGNANNWLHVQLNGTVSNSFGIGARVTLKSPSGDQIRELEGGMGSHSQQNSIPVEFGVGTIDTVPELEVRWPSGIVQIVKNVAANQMLTLVEPTGGPAITSVSVDKSIASEDEVLTFNGITSGSVQTYSWDFNGDGIEDWSSTSFAGPATYAYTTAGVFNARLTVLDSSGLLGAYESTSYITVSNVAPVAEAGSDVTVIEDEYASLNASSSTDTPSDMINLTFKWDLGDGTVINWSTNPGISHNYTTDGQYTVTLTVVDDDGSEHSDTLKVTVNNQAPEADAGVDVLTAEDEEVVFQGFGNDTISDASNLLYKWDFGDGSSYSSWKKNGTIAFTYEEQGDYIVTLSVNDGDITTTDTANVTVYNPMPESFVMENKSANEDSPLAFTGWGTDNPSDLIDLTYNWDFGDGTSSGWLTVSPNTTHTYTEAGVYNATLVVRDGDLATGNGTVVVTVINVAPTAKAGNDIDSEEDYEVYFEGSGSDTDSDISSLEFSWEFGDGSLPTTWSSSSTANHSYTEEGTYKAILRVRDNNLDEAEDNLYATIENVEPRADISAESTRIDENDIINFSAIKSTDTASDMDSLNYTWEFEKGVLTHGLTATYRFLNKGSYDVTLTVEDDDGARDMDAVTITVNNVNPVAKFSVFKQDGTTPGDLLFQAGDEISFDSNGTVDTPNDMNSLTYVWNFDDGNTSTGKAATHKYTKNGEYKVRLTVMDDNSEISNAIIVITVEGEEPAVGGGKSTDEKGVGLVTILAVLVIIVLAALLGTFILFRKKFQKDKPDKSELPEGALTQPMQLDAAMAQPGMPFMEGEMVQGAMPGQAIYQGEAVQPYQLGTTPEDIKPPFCGQCGGKTDLAVETSEWFCTNCNITVPGPAVPPGWAPELEQPQMDTQEELPQLPEGEPEEEVVEEAEAEEEKPEEEVEEGDGEQEEELFEFKKPRDTTEESDE